MNILIVDDSSANRKLLRITLEAEDMTVYEAADGVEALQVLDLENIHVIVSDILMPTMDGYRLCYEVRKVDRYKNIPFIFYTNTYTSPSDEELGLQMGAQLFIRKPAAAGVILNALRKVTSGTLIISPTCVVLDEIDVLKEYSERLVVKLEEKNIELQNTALELEQFSKAVEQTADSVVITDNLGMIQYVNPAFERLTGHTLKELRGKTPRILKSGKQDASFHKKLWQTLLAGKTFRATFTNKKKNGELYDEEQTITPIIDGKGTITNFVSCGKDVTEGRRMAEALQSSEARYRVLFDSNPLPMWVSDLGTLNFLAVNDAAVSHYGYSREEFLSMTATTLRPAEDIPAFFEEMKKETVGTSSQGIWRHKKKDGTIFDVEITAHNIIFSGRRARLVLANDVTDRRRSEEVLAMAHGQLKNLFDSLDAVFFSRDTVSNVLLQISPACLELYGHPPEAFYKNPMLWFEVIHSEDKPRIEADYSRLSKGNPMHWECRIVKPDGEIRWIDTKSNPMLDESGKVIRVDGIVTDITDRRKLQGQLLRAQRLESIGMLASGVAHDLNNVLSPILIALDILGRRHKDQLDQKILKTLESSVQRGAGIVKQVLTFARGLEGECTLLEPRHLIREIESILYETFPKSIELKSDISKDLDLVKADATQLHQVLLNLCVNARDAMPLGGTLKISAENIMLDEYYERLHLEAKQGPYVVIIVSDNGTGISPVVLNKIFDPFFTTKEVGKGTGLGLSTALGIVKAHGGFIDVYTEVGKGTQIKIYIPAVESPEGKGVPEQKKELALGQGELVLLVDDEKSICEIAKSVLETYGYRVIVAYDGTEAIATFVQERKSIKIVVTDMSMPYMDGAATIRALKKINPEVKIIATSGLATSEEAVMSQSLKVELFLQKPYTAAKLVTAIHDVLAGTDTSIEAKSH
jgi:PAS domain S-box-containing protein